MAIVRRLDHQQLQVETSHTEVAATYSIMQDRDGVRYFQVDTYGSADRQMPGKKSQSIRFAPEAIDELKAVIARHFT